MAQVLNFILRPEPPSDAEFLEACPDGGTKPDCEIRVESDFKGANPPDDTYGDLAVVNFPLESETAKCEASVSVWMKPGCPAGTVNMTWDDIYSDDTIARSGVANIGVKDGYAPFEWEIVGGYGFTLDHSETTGRTNILNASSISCGTAQIKVVDMCQTEIVGEVSGEASNLEWDLDNSGDTVIASGNVVVFVKNGSPPYTWSISGSGFSLHSESTYGIQNTIYADATACGSVVITVEDICGAIVTGSVRCTSSGHWVEISGTMIELRDYVSSGNCVSSSDIEGMQGKYKMWEQYAIVCQDMFTCSTGYNCDGMAWTYYLPFDHSVLIPAGEPMDCRTLAGLPGCYSGGDIKVGLCCKAGGSNIISKMGVTNRRVWEWVCP